MRRTTLGSDEGIQATATDAAEGKLSAASLGYFHDPFVRFFVHSRTQGGPGGHGERALPRSPPVINRGNFARVSCVEKLVLEFLTPLHGGSDDAASLAVDGASSGMSEHRGDGKLPQVLSLGAGKDTLFFRLKEKDAAPPGGYVEVDFETVTVWKARMVAKTPVLARLASSGGHDEQSAAAGLPLPGETRASAHPGKGSGAGGGLGLYHLVAADLRDTRVVESALRRVGIDFSAPTIVLAECVLVYMEPRESSALLEWCAASFPDSMFGAYEMTRPDDAFGRVMRQNIQRMGCLLPGLEAFPSLEAQQERFVSAGWDACRAVDMLSIFESYLDPAEVRRASRIEFLDEVEEWELIMRHYCLVVAAKGKDAGMRLSRLPLDRAPLLPCDGKETQR